MTPKSTRARIAAAAALVAVALAGLAAVVLGGPADTGPGPEAGPGALPADAVLRAEPVPSPSVGAKGAPSPRVFYLETTVPRDDIEPGPGGFVVEKCPKGSRVINGYYFQTVDGYGTFEGFGLDDQGSSPFGFRKWAFYFDNVATDDQGIPVEIDGVTFGLVCDKDG